MQTNYIKFWSRHYTVQYCEVALKCYGSESKLYTPLPIDDAFFIPEQGNESIYFNSTDLNKLNKELKITLQNKTGVKKIINNLHKFGRQYIAFGKKLTNNSLKKYSNQQLEQKYIGYNNLAITYCAYLALTHILNILATDEGQKILEKKKVSRTDIYNALFSPTKKVGVLKLQQALLKFKSGEKLSLKDKNNLFKQYNWIPCLDLQNQPWDLKDLDNFYAQLEPEISQPLSFKKASKLVGLNTKEINFFHLTKELAYIKDMRDVYRRQGIFNILPLFNEIARRLNTTRQLIGYFSSEEISTCLKNNLALDSSVAKQRQKGFALYREKNKIIVSTKTADINRLKQKLKQSKLIIEELMGTPASFGKISGQAKIIYNIKDIAKIKKGDIIIAVTTHPDFVPAMQKAAAIVTDEGGLTSHAAIVSRELNKPCIVGAKFATKILKDGDIVEVDANKGIVRKI